MVVEIISIGTELLLGNTLNTNANYLAQKCAELGLINYYQITVGDNKERLESVIKIALSRSDIAILSGGLGPTDDDLTREITAKALGKDLVQDISLKDGIREYFEASGRRDITENNWKQSYIIEGSTPVVNHNGTAPGLIVPTQKDKMVILLPGPPRELIPMFEEAIIPHLRSYLPGTFYSETLKICGFGESRAATIVSDLIESQTNPTIAPYAKLGEVHFRITASAKDEEEGKRLVRPTIEEFEKRFANHIFTNKEDEMLEDVVVKLLNKNKVKLTSAESCTGGLLSGRIINVPGSSQVFDQGFITYSNQSKEKYLDVKKETLDKYGAVSKETAREMAIGAAKNSDSNAAIAITGIAGPGGGTEEKPVGLVYIACLVNDQIDVKEYNIMGNRRAVRERAVIYALNLLRLELIKQYKN